MARLAHVVLDVAQRLVHGLELVEEQEVSAVAEANGANFALAKANSEVEEMDLRSHV
jgi:hypothetical protein